MLSFTPIRFHFPAYLNCRQACVCSMESEDLTERRLIDFYFDWPWSQEYGEYDHIDSIPHS